MRKWYGLAVVAVLVATPVLAREQAREGFGSSRTDLVHSTLALGGAQVEVLAPAGVDVDRLFAGLDREKTLGVEDIFAAVGSKRAAEYPDASIGMAISPAPAKAGDPAKSALVKAIVWWYQSNNDQDYWYAQYVSGAAVVVIDAMSRGQYLLYDRVGNGNYVYRSTVALGATRSTFGGKVLRGFMGVADGSAKGDVILYFFK